MSEVVALLDLLSDIIGRLSFFWILHVTGAGKFPAPLSPQEEKRYLEAFAAGDESAGDKIVEHNLRLVAHIVKKYYATGIDPDDLVSVGTIGLIKAVRTFRPEKAPRLSSYASRCIDNEILMYFRSLKKSSRDISINEEIDSDSEGNALTLMDILATDDTIVDDIEDNVRKEKLSLFIRECLTPRERLIIRLRYGLDGREPLAQREVASILKISRSYVSRIEKRALAKLRERYEGS